MKSKTVAEGTVLWEPTAEVRARAEITRYLTWLRETRGLAFNSYEALWEWSVRDLAAFWESMWEFFEIRGTRVPGAVLERGRGAEGARWFPGATLNFAEPALRRPPCHQSRQDHGPAIVAYSEARPPRTLTHAEVRRDVAAVAAGLRRLGVRRGDRVAAYLPNTPEAAAGLLASASLGAVWSSCPPEFGTRSVIERFRQIEPRVLLAVDGYRYNGRGYDRMEAVREIAAALPTVEAVVVLPYLDERPGFAGLRGARRWADAMTGASGDADGFAPEPVPFDHPLWILYSSGTTGLPKGIMHGHGGVLLEQLKWLVLHADVRPGDRFFWFSTTGWMMWNVVVSSLLAGATAILYDGSPAYPDLTALWRLAAETGTTYFGTSAPFVLSCMKAGLEPGKTFDLSRLRSLGSTGAPLTPEGFAWVYEHVNRSLLLGSASGGTDVATAFVLSCPLLPVRAGELQCRGLGAKVEAWDERGRAVVDEVGELVLTEPMPSMPIGFWHDPDGARYHDSYFARFPGVWRHGDWIKITPRGGCVIYGRSDSTLNRAGVRMGTSEFYRVVEELPEVADSLVIDTGELGREGRLLLFVVLQPGAVLDDRLQAAIRDRLRTQLSPRHVPDEIRQIAEVPRTLNGKKLEVPVKRILAGAPPDRAASRDALANPSALDAFVRLAEERGRGPAASS
ncbi:MAG TPA: acetoacetate--CoA ligase [bacterium]|nr:acetoacetate--CoA ligase [bacterium]